MSDWCEDCGRDLWIGDPQGFRWRTMIFQCSCGQTLCAGCAWSHEGSGHTAHTRSDREAEEAKLRRWNAFARQVAKS